MFQALWPWYTLEAPGTVPTALLSKIFLQNCFFHCLLGKHVLIQHKMSSSFFCAPVVFPLSCKLQKGISRASPGLWRAVKLRGLLMHGRLQDPQPQTPQPHPGSNSFSITVTADTDDHIVQEACEDHKQIQKLRNQGPRLTLRSYHTTANWL